MQQGVWSLLVLALILLLAMRVLAANDPGHDVLYVEQQGDSNLTGSLNISQQLRVANLIYSSYLDILGNGSQPTGSFAQVYAFSGGNDLAINAPQRVWLARDAGSMVHVGQSNVDLNVSRHLYVGGAINATGGIYTNNTPVQQRVSGTCGAGEAIASINADGTVACVSTSGSSSGAGWTNTSTTTSTSLDVNVGAGTFFANATSNRVGVNTTAPNYTLDVAGTIRASAAMYVGSAQVCTASNGLCGGAGNITGSGAANALAKWTNGTNVGTSVLSDDGSAVTVGGTLDLSGNLVTNVGSASTDFTAGGGLALAGNLSVATSVLTANVSSGQVGIGTASPTKRLEVSNGSQGFTFDPSAALSLVQNTTGGTNLTIASAGGSVIVRLG